MPRRATPLSAAKVGKATKPGRICDGEAKGLYLLIRDKERKYWVFRFTRDGKMREAGLGPAAGPGKVSLADAREKAKDLHRAVRDGKDPLKEREAEKAKAKADAALAAANSITFRDVADRFLDAHEASWRNPKHRMQWRNTLRDYVLPVIGDLPVSAIATGEVMTILEPLWREKAETASRVRGRIESILDYAKARGWRAGENPARWRGHLDHLLPARSKVRKVAHHAAMPWRDVPTFVEYLHGYPAGHISATALLFTIFTAARTGEVIGAKWDEIDFASKTWTVPASRMKAGREHRVPLCPEVVRILELVPRIKGESRVFPISNMAMPMLLRRAKISVTVHGMRSAFRDWAAEATNFPRELAERALAHTLSDKVEAAYQRGDMFEKRRKLMQAWASFCCRPAPVAEVLNLMERKA